MYLYVLKYAMLLQVDVDLLTAFARNISLTFVKLLIV